MLQTKPNRSGCVSFADVIAPANVLRLAAGRCSREIRGECGMIGMDSAHTVVRLATASALTLFLGACSSFNLPSMSTNTEPAPEPGVAPEMPATIRPTESSAAGASPRSESGRSRPDRKDGARPVQAALRDQCRAVRRRGHASGGPGDAAGAAAEGKPERQELYRTAGPDPRRAGPRDCLVRRPCHGHPLHRRMPGPGTATWSTSAARRG